MGPKVLLTGANDFLGTHVLHLLTEVSHTLPSITITYANLHTQQNYNVTAVVRSASKAEDVLQPNDNWNYHGTIRIVIVPDFAAPGVFDDVFKNDSFDYVVHTAAPMPRTSGRNLQADYLDPAIGGYGTHPNL